MKNVAEQSDATCFFWRVIGVRDESNDDGVDVGEVGGEVMASNSGICGSSAIDSSSEAVLIVHAFL